MLMLQILHGMLMVIIKMFEKTVSQDNINKAIHATIKYAYNRIVNNIEIQTPF